jgi:imidazolonepropionase-like amidohydrolase
VVQRTRAANATDVARRLLALDLIGIKIHRGLNEIDLRGIVAEAERAGRPVYGHTYEMRPTGWHDYTRGAVEAGVKGIFHVLGIAPVQPDREPVLRPGAGWEQGWLHIAARWLHVDSAGADSLIALMIRKGAWLQPTLVTEELVVDVPSYRADTAWRYGPVNQPRDLEGWPQFQGSDLDRYRESYERMKWFVGRFHAAGGMVVAGTDGVRIPGFGLADELTLLTGSGLSSHAALQAATRNAARAFRLDKELGTIEPGKLADMVLLDGDPLVDIANVRRVRAVTANGHYLDRAALDTLLAAAERPVPR